MFHPISPFSNLRYKISSYHFRFFHLMEFIGRYIQEEIFNCSLLGWQSMMQEIAFWSWSSKKHNSMSGTKFGMLVDLFFLMKNKTWWFGHQEIYHRLWACIQVRFRLIIYFIQCCDKLSPSPLRFFITRCVQQVFILSLAKVVICPY